ncbi:MAG: RluA family pseudouridine synthase [Myxococcota bacterium]
MSERVVVVAGPEAKGLRVDQFIARSRPELSRARVQALIEEGRVRIADASIKASQRLQGTEEIVVEIPAAAPAEPEPEALPITVIHEDRDLLVIDKAAGMVVHPGAGHASGTLVNALLHHVKDLRGVGGELRPGIVHRLDKDTSGLLVIAKHDEALRGLQAAFKSRDVEKTYLALVHGQPPDEGTFRTLHGRHPTHRMRFTGKVKTGKPAVTHFKVTKRFPRAARVEVGLETGRTHQIRVHFAEAGFPLLSDALYGSKAAQRGEIIARQALHAWKLAFTHPRTQQRLSFTAPVPKDFRDAEKRLASEHAADRQ